jgi:glycosyltransferase involved in cell wall biosynthesis
MLLLRLTAKQRFHIIHVHTLPDLMVFVAFVPRLFGARVVLDLHELSPELYAHKFGLSFRHSILKLVLLSERISVQWANRICVTTKPQAELLLARCRVEYPPFIVMNAPDSKLFKVVDIGTRPPAKVGAFKIVHHGTLAHRLGVDIAVKALAEISAEVPEAQLFIHGSGDFLQDLREEVRRLGLQARVHMSGHTVPLDTLASVIGDAHIGVVPNRDGPMWKWALPTKLMEYVALGIPTVVARTAGVTEYFDDSMVMFFSPDDASDLARCILKLYKDPELRRSLARNASKFLESHSWDQEKEKLFSLVDSLEV